jgi:hypothetical protein
VAVSELAVTASATSEINIRFTVNTSQLQVQLEKLARSSGQIAPNFKAKCSFLRNEHQVNTLRADFWKNVRLARLRKQTRLNECCEGQKWPSQQVRNWIPRQAIF